MAKIRAVVVEGDREHGYKRVQVLFGTNYFLEIVEDDGRVEFLLGAHHTGFKADASTCDARRFYDKPSRISSVVKYINECDDVDT